MVSLLSANACLDVEKVAAMKQAQPASRVVEELMKGGEADTEMKEKLQEKEKELSKALKDVASMKTQAENLSAEYDRLCDQKNALERKLAIQGTGDKKDDKIKTMKQATKMKLQNPAEFCTRECRGTGATSHGDLGNSLDAAQLSRNISLCKPTHTILGRLAVVLIISQCLAV